MKSGRDLRDQASFKILSGRLGVYNQKPDPLKRTNLDGLAGKLAELERYGGVTQQERMIKDKRRSLDSAVKYSYQAAKIKKAGDATDEVAPALINPNKLKQDYDDKTLSVGFEYNIKCGDVIEWLGTKTHWLVYLQDLTELAYFRGDIRKCSYQISWQDSAGVLHSVFAAIRGPVETKINSLTSHGVSIDTPNYSLSLLVPKNNDTIHYFKRYSKFYLQGSETCWRVEAIDELSTPGILEVSAAEYYANEIEDDINNGIVGGLIVTPESPNTPEEEETIQGDTFIKVKKTYSYKFKGTAAKLWRVDSKYPVILRPDPKDPRKVTIQWTNAYSGQFDLYYGDIRKTIIVESLF